MTYQEWIEEEADLIHADGCSGVTNFAGWACLEHDLHYFHGKSAASAYRLWKSGEALYWEMAAPVTFDEANEYFRAALFRESALGYLNPMAWWRHRAMRLRATRAAWDAHREREKTDAHR